MNVKNVEKQEKNTVELVIEVSHEEFEAAIEKVYKKQRGSISVPGFRKGHASRKMVERMFGSSVFYEEAVNEAYPMAYAQAIEQEKLDAVAWPNVNIMEVGENGFSFQAIVTVRPEVKLGEYKGLTAPKADATVTEADIETELKPFVSRATRLVAVEREAKLGDTVDMDYEGFDQGVPFEGGKGEGHSLELGSNSFVPGFEEQLVGLKAGDEKDLDITFPEDYQAELAGKPVVFKVKINEVKEAVAPIVDDEFAKDVSEFDTLADLKKDLGDKLRDRRETQSRSAFESALLEQVVGNMECEIPDVMVEVQTDKLMEDYDRRITAQGIPFEQYLAMIGMTKDDMRKQASESALHQVQVDLALGAVAVAENIEITEADLEEELKKLAEQYQLTPEQVKAAVPEEDLKKDLKTQKASQLIFDSAKIGQAPAEKPAKKPAAKKDAEEGEEKKAGKKAATKKAADEETPAPKKKAAPKKAAVQKDEE